jgi:site-specific DNA-methyltransferase (adenine-specific)
MSKENQCYNMDCMEGMAKFPDGYFDLAVVDPPYFSGPERRGFYGRRDGGILGRRNDYHIAKDKWQVPDERYFKELQRVARWYIVWGCNYYQHNFPPGRIVWDKCNASSSFSDAEIAATNIHDSVRLFRYMWNGMMQGKSIMDGATMQGDKSKNEKRIHPTQKPVMLYDWIFSKYAKPGYKVLDTHLGSGSSRIAAYEAGLEFIGFEIDPEIFTAQEQRFADHTAQQSLFHILNKCNGGNEHGENHPPDSAGTRAQR